MTRDELREKVSDALSDLFLGSQELRGFYEDAADAAIDTIFAALKEPTEEMVLAAGKAWGITVTSNEYENMQDEWRLMLNASPLAPKE